MLVTWHPSYVLRLDGPAAATARAELLDDLAAAADVIRADASPAVTAASMAPGVNAYLFASIYNSAKRVAASTVLVSTALSILTIWFWISVLP